MVKREQKELKNSVRQDQIHDLLFNREIGWQEIIYDLINTEQLDPWNINIIILTDRYLEKVQNLEEADFFVSSKVLLAAALLLRIKSEFLLNKYLKSIDEILFDKKEEEKHRETERIELDEDIPELVPRSPLPRFRRVSLQELMESLNKAIVTENRRVRKEIINRNALREVDMVMPKKNISIKNKIHDIYQRIFSHFKENKDKKRISYTDFVKGDREEKIISFAPLLHLEHQKKIWLEQEAHFEEIYIWLKHVYFQNNPDPFAELKEEIQEEIEQEISEDEDKKKRVRKIEKDFADPLEGLSELMGF